MKNKVRVGLIIIGVVITINISLVFSMGSRVEKDKAESVVQKKEIPGLKEEKVLGEKKQESAIVKAGVEKKIMYEKKVLLKGGYGSKPGEYMDVGAGGEGNMGFVTLDINGNIYMKDQLNNRIQKYNRNGKLLKIIPMKFGDGKKVPNIKIEDGEEVQYGYRFIPSYAIETFQVDKDGFIYAYEIINKEHIKYDQRGKELGRTKQAIGVHYINGRPFTFTGGNEITYIRLEGNSVIMMEVKALPAGVKTIKGNYYAEDFEKLNSYWIEDGENEKEKKIVVKNKDKEIIREIKIVGEGKIDYFNIVHIDEYGSMWVSFGGKTRPDQAISYEKIYSLDNKILAETKIIGGYNIATKVKNDIPSLAYMMYIMDQEGNLYKLNSEDIPLTLTKWERKYIE